MENKSMSVVIGAVVGCVVGAACLTVASSIAPSNLYATTAVRPAVRAATLPVAPAGFQARSVVGASAASSQSSSFSDFETVAQPQGAAVYGWAFALFATVAGAVNGFFWNRRVSMAATSGRREALLAGVAAAGMAAGPAFAAYGDSANVFGKPKDVEQYFSVSGDGWSATQPGKYNISKEREFPGVVGRWEDNFDAVNNSYVIVRDSGKSSVTEFGSLDEVRNSIVTPLLGQQAFDGQSISEGGFAPGRYASAAVLDQKEEVKNGKTYYYYEILTRTADGNEGGRHQLFVLAVNSKGKLVIFKHQAGDKRWFKGLEKPLRSSIEGFRVA